MKKATQSESNTPPIDDAFQRVSTPEEENPTTFKKVRLPISADGIDWSAIPEDQKPQVIAMLAGDEELLTQIVSSSGDEEGDSGLGSEPEGPKKYLRDEHAHTFLGLLSMVEKKFLPPIIRKILHRPMAPEVVEQAFQFSEKQQGTITPALLEMGEELIPEKYKIIIAYGSDRYKAIGLIAWAMKEQVENAVKLQLDYEKDHPPAKGANGQEKPENQGKVM